MKLSRKALVLGLAPVVGAGFAVATTQTAEAANLGTISLSPASGSYDAPTTFTAETNCNAASDKYKVTMAGAGLTGEVNIIGSSALPSAGGQVAGQAIAAGTFHEFANANGMTLTGPYTLSIKCMHGISTVDDTFTQTVTFAGSGAATTYSVPVPATPTPTPSPSPSPSPPPSPVPPDATGTVNPGTGSVTTGAPASGGTGTAIGLSADGVAGSVSIFNQPTAGSNPGALPSGAELVGKAVQITAPTQTGAAFYTFTFTLDGTFGAEPIVFKDGALVPDCTGAGATPTPSCVADVTAGASTTTITVRTQTASLWQFAEPAGPNTAGEDITVDVPSNALGGALTITVTAPGDGAVNMGTPATASQDGTFFLNYTAPMDPVTVTDNRFGAQAWTVVGQMSNFDPALIFGRYMGWTPSIAVPGMGAVAGGTVPSGYPGTGGGLHDSQILASAPDGHEGGTASETTAGLGASLNLHVPSAVPTGTYTGTLTLTALS